LEILRDPASSQRTDCHIFSSNEEINIFDFLQEYECAGNHFGVVVGDVTGHGVDAALLMTTARAFLRARASQCGGISQITTEMNRFRMGLKQADDITLVVVKLKETPGTADDWQI
jgi:serine phosphatase RsbU (regulator of sigma subunit)